MQVEEEEQILQSWEGHPSWASAEGMGAQLHVGRGKGKSRGPNACQPRRVLGGRKGRLVL